VLPGTCRYSHTIKPPLLVHWAIALSLSMSLLLSVTEHLTATEHLHSMPSARKMIMNYSKQWILDIYSLHKLHIWPHLQWFMHTHIPSTRICSRSITSTEKTTCIAILCSTSSYKTLQQQDEINGRSYFMNGHAKCSSVSHLANQTSWVIWCTGYVHRNFNYYHLQLGAQCIHFDHSHLHWLFVKQRARGWKITSCDIAT